MIQPVNVLVIALTGIGLLAADAAEGDLVFRSDVSLVRVDAQVVDRHNQAITGLRATDFVLLEGGKQQEIRNFASEDLPVDVLLLLDVSGSMEPHIERIASAANQAFQVLGDDDRIAIMVFDRRTRLRLPFRKSLEAVERELSSLLHQETFDGGTDIIRGLLDAAAYMAREGRRDARRAIVILTDDQTERGRDEVGVARALTNADSVLSAIIAPDGIGSGTWTGRRSPSGSSWPSGPSLGGPLGGIIWGRRGPYGNRTPGPVITMPRTQPAGTAEMARRSGGDSMRVDDASALEITLSRIRQRYALHFHLPEGVKPGQEREIEVQLTAAARQRYPFAEVRFRRVYVAPGGSIDAHGTASEPTVISRAPAEPVREEAVREERMETSRGRRRPGVNEPGGPRVTTPVSSEPQTEATDAPKSSSQGITQTKTSGVSTATSSEQEPQKGGWRKLKPGEEP